MPAIRKGHYKRQQRRLKLALADNTAVALANA